jgi:hypothetical protein
VLNEVEASHTKEILEFFDISTVLQIIQEMKPEVSSRVLELMDVNLATSIILQLEPPNLRVIIIKELNPSIAARILLSLDLNDAVSFILELDPQDFEVIEVMANLNLQESAKRIEETVKTLIEGIDPDQQYIVVGNLTEILSHVSSTTILDLLIEIANLPETPQIVALLIEAMDLPEAIDVSSNWIQSVQKTDFVQVIDLLSTDTLGNIYSGLNGSERITLYALLSNDTLSSLPSIGVFEVSDLKITPEDVQIGEEVIISVTLSNTGNETDDYTVSLKVDGVVEGTEIGILEESRSRDITFNVIAEESGFYSIDVEGKTGILTVWPAPIPATYVYSLLLVSPTDVFIGDLINVRITVTNTGELTGSHQVLLSIDDEVVQSKEIGLSSGESELVSFDLTADMSEGEHIVRIGELTGRVNISKEELLFPLATVVTVVVVLAFLGVSYLYRRYPDSFKFISNPFHTE